MTWVEIISIFVAFCLIYGLICFMLGVLYGAERIHKREHCEYRSGNNNHNEPDRSHRGTDRSIHE